MKWPECCFLHTVHYNACIKTAEKGPCQAFLAPCYFTSAGLTCVQSGQACERPSRLWIYDIWPGSLHLELCCAQQFSRQSWIACRRLFVGCQRLWCQQSTPRWSGQACWFLHGDAQTPSGWIRHTSHSKRILFFRWGIRHKDQSVIQNQAAQNQTCKSVSTKHPLDPLDGFLSNLSLCECHKRICVLIWGHLFHNFSRLKRKGVTPPSRSERVARDLHSRMGMPVPPMPSHSSGTKSRRRRNSSNSSQEHIGNLMSSPNLHARMNKVRQ